MSTAPDEGDGEAEQTVTFTLSIEDGESVITMRGDRDTAVVVRSASGERIYLPPEDFERAAQQRSNSPYQSAQEDSPYQSAQEDSPYQSARRDDPYQPARQTLPREGLVPTADGYRIRHPEPVTDVRVLR
jgi:hypothetical protein